MNSTGSVSGVRRTSSVIVHGRGVRLRIVDRDLKVHVSEVSSMEAFHDMQRVGRRIAHLIDPDLSIEASRINDKRLTHPPTGRVAEPCRNEEIRRRSWLPSTEEDLSPESKRLVENHDESGRLHDLPWQRRVVDSWDTLR